MVLRRATHSLFFHFANSFREPPWNRQFVESVQITMAEELGIEGRGKLYDQTGALRDVVQNHLLQVLTNITTDLPGTGVGRYCLAGLAVDWRVVAR